ncbi:hypothetical protein HY989_03105 [Candidatus Micrarchaeota archaeon]|nr:hypothetical protein [Candidatus Micrarchaeota archaeon]
MGASDFLTIDEFSKFVAEAGYPLEIKNINFRRDKIKFGDNPEIPPELYFRRVKGFRKGVISKQEAEEYLERLKQISFHVTNSDVKTVIGEYDQVLQRPRKFGMRGDRNFTGKVEDEIKGKLVEIAFSNFVESKKGYRLPVDFHLISEKEAKRDAGDFTHYLENDKKYKLAPDKIIAIKSTNGYFLAIPTLEMDWEGQIIILVKLHLLEDFLLKILRAGVSLDHLELNQKIGWLEILGWIQKPEFLAKGHRGKRLPGKYHVRREDWDKENIIMHPSELKRNPEELYSLLDELKISSQLIS